MTTLTTYTKVLAQKLVLTERDIQNETFHDMDVFTAEMRLRARTLLNQVECDPEELEVLMESSALHSLIKKKYEELRRLHIEQCEVTRAKLRDIEEILQHTNALA